MPCPLRLPANRYLSALDEPERSPEREQESERGSQLRDPSGRGQPGSPPRRSAESQTCRQTLQTESRVGRSLEPHPANQPTQYPGRLDYKAAEDEVAHLVLVASAP